MALARPPRSGCLPAPISPTSGSITIDGLRLDRDTTGTVRARVGFLTAVPGFWERLTARSNFLSYAKLYRLPDPQPRVEALLHQFQLWDRRDDRVA